MTSTPSERRPLRRGILIPVALIVLIAVLASVLAVVSAALSNPVRNTRASDSLAQALATDGASDTGTDMESGQGYGQDSGQGSESSAGAASDDGTGGTLPDGTTPFDASRSGIANLDPRLSAALREAATDAASDDRVEFIVNSGWRSATLQRQLLADAVATYGSEKEAARWVATPETSPHVSGDAVDVGFDAADWLADNGSRYGLCRIYDNEPWHFELRPEAVREGCPRPYFDPTYDPRMSESRQGSR